MHLTLRTVFCMSLAAAMAAPLAAAEPGPASFSSMVANGSVKLDFRYRFELVEQAGFGKDAEASTLRSRLSFASADYKGLSFLAEFDDITDIGDDDFNSTANGNTAYPVVADPEGTEINQAWLRYGIEEYSGIYGRQRIELADQRFVGGVAWRQNEQTFDGLRLQWQGPAGVFLDYSYIYNVNRIFGPDDGPAQPANLGGDNHFVLLGWDPSENHSISGFAYLLDIDFEEGYVSGKSVDNSSDTFGVRYTGQFGPVKLQAAYANQTEAGASTLDYSTQYYMLEGAITIRRISATLGSEVLGADNGVGFKTPYATLHKFQGWADKFLFTPGEGIEDVYLGVSGRLGPTKLAAVYHDFRAHNSSKKFGSELDIVATWPLNQLWLLQFKYANFDSAERDRYQDTKKLWMTVNLTL